MADKYYDGTLTRDMDWGGDSNTGGLPATGRAVQEFIKNEFGTKFGYLNMRFNETLSMYYIECFANEDDFNKYEDIEDKESEEAQKLILQNVQIPISTVQGDTYTALLSSTISNSANIVVSGDKLTVPVNYRSIKITQLGTFNAQMAGTIVVQRKTSTSDWKVVANIPDIPSSEPTDETTVTNVEIGQYLEAGKQNIRLQAIYTYEDENGEQKTARSGFVVVGASVTKTELKLTLSTNYYSPIKAINSETGANNRFEVSYRVFGAVDKSLYVKVEGAAATKTVKVDLDASQDGATAGVSEEESTAYLFLQHGMRQVTAWVEAQDGLGNTIVSDTLVNQFMVVNETSSNYDATKKYLLLQNVKSKVTNFIQTNLTDYAVYAPDGSSTELTFQLTDASDSPYLELVKTVEANKENSLLATVEIESTDESVVDSYNTRFYVWNGDVNFIKESLYDTSSTLYKRGYYDVVVDNSEAIIPLSGTTFLMSPKSRDNSESDPKVIYNAKANNQVVASTWENFGFINDGWMTDENNQKVLRVMAGQKLTISRNIWKQFMSSPASSMTFEMDFKVSNVTNTTDALVSILGGTNKGIILNALKGWVKTASYNDNDNCMFAWREEKRVHLVVNINHQVYPIEGGGVKYPASSSAQANGSIAVARVLLNGYPEREVPFSTTDTAEWCDDENASIIIGNDGADIDIYSIRVYENKQLDWKDLMQRNYLSTLSTTEEKQKQKQRNSLLSGGRITLDKALELGMNCIVYHGQRPYYHADIKPKLWLEYHRFDNNGNKLLEYSGTNCQATSALEGKRQGTTANSYWDSNIQEDNSKVTGWSKQIQVPVADLHESIVIASEPYEGTVEYYNDDDELEYTYEGMVVDIYGGNLGKNYPLENGTKPYPYNNGVVTVPDGWIDGNGKYRGMGYQVAEGTPLAQKKVAKINYASAMQSHLLGACKSYDDLHYACVGASHLQQQYLGKGLTRPVSAKHTEPFMMFWDEGDGNVYYTGLCVYGAGKMDKVSWGYVKKLHPMFAMFEGSDNDPVLTNFLVPFDEDVTYDTGEEGFLYNGETSFDFDAGATNDDDTPKEAIVNQWKKFHNFIYLNSTNITHYDGTSASFRISTEEASMRKMKVWCTQGDEKYHLLRYNFVTGEWVDAGLKGSDGKYGVIDIFTDVRTASLKTEYETSTAYAELSEAIKAEYSKFFHANGKFVMSMESLLFLYCYVLMFLSGTDNSAKNTYYKIDPIVQDMSDEADDTFSSWWASAFGESFDYTQVYHVYFDGDDMDSILPLNNKGNLTKPYYIERLYPYSDEDSSTPLYEGMSNALFNLVETAYSDSERSDMMKLIMNKMAGLVTEDDVMLGEVDTPLSVWGFLHKYFFNVQNYFPQMAYIEQARMRYEFAELMGHLGARSVRPISQSIGAQLESEQQFMEQRLVYMASFAQFGALGDNTGAIGLKDAGDMLNFQGAPLPDGTPATITMTVTPHQYIYPCAFNGQSYTRTLQRTSPKQTCTLTVASGIDKETDTTMGIRGANYYSDFGDLSKVSIITDFKFVGKRLTKATCRYQSNNLNFRPSSITFSSPNIKTIFLYPSYNGANSLIDISSCIRLESATFYLQQEYEVKCPKSSILNILDLGWMAKNIELSDVPNLKSLLCTGESRVRKMTIGANVGTNVEGFTVQPIVESIYTAQKSQTSPNLQSIHVENVNWTDFDVEALSWFADRPTCEFLGKIAIKETSDSPLITAVTWDLKNKFNAKFGNVDTTSSSSHKGLLLDYKVRELNVDGLKISGNFYVEKGNTFQFEVKPSSIYENNFASIDFYIDISPSSSKVSLTRKGLLTISSLSDSYDEMILRAAIGKYAGGYEMYLVYKTIEIWNRPAQLGDLVYADGTFSSLATYDEEKTPIGVCFYVAPRDADGNVIEKYANPNDKQLRLMVSLKDVTLNVGGTEENTLQWGSQYRDLGQSEDWNNQYALHDGKDDSGNYISLTSDSANLSSIYDISSIQNLTTRGLDNLYIDPDPTTNPNGESDYRSTDDEALSYNYGFKLVDANTAIGDGFGYNETQAFVTARTLTDDNGLKALAGSAYKSLTGNVIVNSAYAKTLKVIQHRNWLLNNNIYGADTETPLISAETFAIPSNLSSSEELEALGDVMSRLRAWAKDTHGDSETNARKWSQLAYPFVSACYAYEPVPTDGWKDGEVLADKFKAHNWFAPTEGLLARIQWYVKYGDAQGVGVISDAVNKLGSKIIKFSSSSHHWSVTEYSTSYSWLVHFLNGYTYPNSKPNSLVGRAVAAF